MLNFSDLGYFPFDETVKKFEKSNRTTRMEKHRMTKKGNKEKDQDTWEEEIMNLSGRTNVGD